MVLAQTSPIENVQLYVQGDITGHVAIGNYIVQIGSIHGGVVNIAMPEQQPRVQPRPTPVFLRPKPFPGLLDRQTEIRTATATLRSGQPVELSGEAGVGKSVLLRYLAYHCTATDFPHGIVHRSARQQPLADLLQDLFERFFESDPPTKLTDAQIQHALQSQQALILLDDVELTRNELEILRNFAPGCTFLWASAERRLWGEGRSVALRGLPPEDALVLIERELGRELTPAERASVQLLHTTLEGHPLRILRAVALAQDEGYSLAAITSQVQTATPAETLTRQALGSLLESEHRILVALAALRGVPLHVEHVAALTEFPDVATILETLQQRGIVQAHSPSYTLTGALDQILEQGQDLTPWREQALTYFTVWAEQRRQTPDLLLEEAAALRQILTWAIETGHWPEALRLARAIEGALAVSRRWGAWAQVLQGGLRVAQALGDQAAEAWALHQLGTRAMCLGDTPTARIFLLDALHLRESLGDRIGAAITRHNLNLLLGPPPPPQSPSQPPPEPAPAPVATLLLTLTKIAALLAVLFLLLGVGGLFLFRDQLAELTAMLEGARKVSTSAMSPQPDSTSISQSTPIPLGGATSKSMSKSSDTITMTNQAGPPTATFTPTPTARIAPIIFAEGVTPEGAFTNPSTLFAEGMTEVYATFDYSGMSAGEAWEQIWLLNGNEFFRNPEVWTGEAAGRLTRVLADQGKPLPAGEWSLEIYVEGILHSRGTFMIRSFLGEPLIGPITFALDATEDYQPINPDTSFTAGMSEVHAIFNYSGMAPGYIWERVWSHDGAEILRRSEEWTGSPTGGFDEVIRADSAPLSPGQWTLELYVEGIPLSQGSFTIIEEVVIGPCSPPPAPLGVFNDFELPTTWDVGDQPYGNLGGSSPVQAYSGSYAGELKYNFPAVSDNFVVLSWPCALAGNPTTITAQVYGNGSGYNLNAWIKDSASETWAFPFGQVKHTGWQPMTAWLDPSQSWPTQSIAGPSNEVVDYPISFEALVLDGVPDGSGGSGTIYIDDLASGVGGPLPSVIDTPPTSEPAVPPVVVAAAPTLEFQPEFATINEGESITLSWNVENVKEVYFNNDEGVPGQGTKVVTPVVTTTYTLRVVLIDGSERNLESTISVIPKSSPAPPPQLHHPPSPLSVSAATA